MSLEIWVNFTNSVPKVMWKKYKQWICIMANLLEFEVQDT